VAFWSRPASHIAHGGRLREVKVARIGTDGKYRGDPKAAAVDVPGGAGAPVLLYPPQISLAVSLATAKRGKSGRGRFYLPCPQTSMGPDGRISQNIQTAVAGSVRTWINDLNNWPGFDGGTPKVTIASSLGQNHDVTGVRVGRVLDTVRSRREDLVETYGPVVAL
jgi:hypothetical protein